MSYSPDIECRKKGLSGTCGLYCIKLHDGDCPKAKQVLSSTPYEARTTTMFNHLCNYLDIRLDEPLIDFHL